MSYGCPFSFLLLLLPEVVLLLLWGHPRDKKNNNERVVGTVIRFPWSFLSTTWVYVCPGMTFICTIRSRHSSTTTDQWYALQASDYSSRRQFKYECSTLIRPFQLLLSFLQTTCMYSDILSTQAYYQGSTRPCYNRTSADVLTRRYSELTAGMQRMREWGLGEQGATYIIQKANTLRNMNWNKW